MLLYIWDAIFVQNQICWLLRPLLRCDVALASPVWGLQVMTSQHLATRGNGEL